MDPRSRARSYTVLTMVVAWFGVLMQGYLSLNMAVLNGNSLFDGLVTFLGFFTILSNILVCCALTLPLAAPASAAGKFFAGDFAAGGVAASIAFVGISYHLLLRTIWAPRGAQLVADWVLHYVVPALFVVYWFVYCRRGSLRWVYPLYWSAYPVAYFVYVLIRGEVIGSYPYHFIDASAIGYGRTTVNAFGLLAAFIVLGSLFVACDRYTLHWLGRSDVRQRKQRGSR
jgi:hypothetical protein